MTRRKLVLLRYSLYFPLLLHASRRFTLKSIISLILKLFSIPLLFTFYLVGSLVYCLLWQLFGRENIKIRNHTLSHGYTLFSIGRWRSFPLSEISKWHSCDHIPKAPVAQGRKQRLPNVSLYQNGMKRKIHNIPNILRIQKCVQGAWAFDYQGKTIRIGDFFDSRDFQTVNIELNRFIPTSAKARQLKDAL